MNIKKELMEALVQLRECVPLLADRQQVVFQHYAYHPDFGICCNVEDQIATSDYATSEEDSMLELMGKLMQRWPNSTDDTGYPVGGYEEYMKEYDSRDMWNNPRRLELLDWMIETLALEIKNEN